MIQIFIHEKEFEGCGGQELTDEIKITVFPITFRNHRRDVGTNGISPFRTAPHGGYAIFNRGRTGLIAFRDMPRIQRP